MSSDRRICFYRKEHREHKNVQVLCDECHHIKTADDAQAARNVLQFSFRGNKSAREVGCPY